MIHAFTVAVNYADFLQFTLPELTRIVDKVTVITTEEDKAVQELAAQHKADVHLTKWLKHNFRKGKAINEAILATVPADWILHIDADIGLLAAIDTSALNKATLYGAERYSIRSVQGWGLVQCFPEAFHKMSPCPQDAPFTKERYRMRARIHRRKVLPPGYFQLWHSSHICSYPCRSIDASLDDILHTDNFNKTAILPNFGVYHLESEDHDLKANWQGRTTGHFSARRADSNG